MAFNKARGSQIQAGAITNAHIAEGAAIDESKLSIDWSARTQQILASRTVIDFVQVNGKAVPGNSGSITVTSNISAPVADSDDDRGAVVQSGKNLVIIRDSVTGEPLRGEANKEVYGKLTHDGSDYILTFYTKDGNGDEVTHTIADATTIDFQFPQRFDLATVSETFAANEKFVDGAADVSTRLDIEQIAKDVFGAGYSLDKDGQANRAKSIADELVDETSGVVNTTVRAKNVIDEVVAARGGQVSLDARLIAIESGVSDNASDISDIQSEIASARGSSASLADELARIENAASNSNDEVVGARTSAITGAHASLADRIGAAETRYEAVKDEVEAARGGSEDLAEELARIEGKADDAQSDANDALAELQTARNGKENLNAELEAIRQSVADEASAREGADTALGNRVTALEAKDHEHFAEDKQVQSGDPLIGTSNYTLQSGTFVAGNKSLQVYVNGFLQMVGVHYTEVTDGNGNGVGVSFAPELIVEGDVLQFRWHK
jgi:hypothetical protein